MIAVLPSATLTGAVGRSVSVEVHVSNGLPAFTVVGLPDAAVRESRDRVRAALLSSGLVWPLRRVTVNLAPSGVRKGGAGLDLPIAIGLLVASEELSADVVAGVAFIGELGLDGTLRHVPGVVALADCVTGSTLVVPAIDGPEALAVRPGAVRLARTLRQVVEALRGSCDWAQIPATPHANVRSHPREGPDRLSRARARPLDLSQVRGQRLGRRALEVAAAGGHHLLLVGPPGSGKTMLAERLPGLLPDLTRDESLEVSRVHSAAGLSLASDGLMVRPPFRAPHHGASAVSLVGGGTWSMRPGEISLATQGVLFLDEMGEFPAAVLDALRQPLEEGVVRVSRARGTVVYPARFLLIGAMNPCPCGEGASMGSCRCSEAARARYARRVSAPLLDRFDLAVSVGRTDPDELLADDPGEASSAVAARVTRVRAAARARGVSCNAELDASDLERYAPLSDQAVALLEDRLRGGVLSARGLRRVQRVARTLGDLEGADELDDRHVAEALTLRAGRAALAIGGDR